MPPAPAYIASHDATLQVRQLVEQDKELVLSCLACERTSIWSLDAILRRFRSSPGATLAAIQLKTKCPGCGNPAKIATADGPHFNELLPRRHDFQERQASFVRRVLSQAGIDPATWGYHPLNTPTKIIGELGPDGEVRGARRV